MKTRLVILTILLVMVGLMLAPAMVGWRVGAAVDMLGWANYGLLGFKLFLGGIGIVYYLRRNREEDEA